MEQKNMIIAILVLGVIMYFYSTSKKGTSCENLKDNDSITEECFVSMGKSFVKELTGKFDTYYARDCPSIGKDKLKEQLDSMKEELKRFNDNEFVDKQLKISFISQVKPNSLTVKQVRDQFVVDGNMAYAAMEQAINSMCTLPSAEQPTTA
jgi:hypothetical protein